MMRSSMVRVAAAPAMLLLLMCSVGADEGRGVTSRGESTGERQSVPKLKSTVLELAHYLKQAGPDARADFAWIAADEMIKAYEGELIELEAQLGSATAGPVNRRWMRATREYASRLREIADGITPETPVRITLDAPGLLQLQIDGAVVVVSGPRIAEPDFLGQRIVERYCTLRACGFLPAAPATIVQPEASEIKAAWSFSQGRGPVCVTDTGLEFEFNDTAHLTRKRSACLELAWQLEELVKGLRRAAETGTFIDWAVLKVVPVAPGMPEQVVLNRQGDYLRSSVPSLGASETLQRLALPWVKARVLGRPHSQTFPRTERFVAGLSPPG